MVRATTGKKSEPKAHGRPAQAGVSVKGGVVVVVVAAAHETKDQYPRGIRRWGGREGRKKNRGRMYGMVWYEEVGTEQVVGEELGRRAGERAPTGIDTCKATTVMDEAFFVWSC